MSIQNSINISGGGGHDRNSDQGSDMEAREL